MISNIAFVFVHGNLWMSYYVAEGLWSYGRIYRFLSQEIILDHPGRAHMEAEMPN